MNEYQISKNSNQQDDDWNDCHIPVICIFNGQFESSGDGPVKAWHYAWGIMVLPVDHTSAFDMLKDKVERELPTSLDEQCSNLMNHGTVHGDDVDDFCKTCNEATSGNCDGVDPENCGSHPCHQDHNVDTENLFVEAHDLLKDIVNASGNDLPYNTRELDKICSPVIAKLYNRLNN